MNALKSANTRVTSLLRSIEEFEPSIDGSGNEIIGTIPSENPVKMKFIRRASDWVVGVDCYAEVDGVWCSVYINNGAASTELINAWRSASDKCFVSYMKKSDERNKKAYQMVSSLEL
jgi:hypothetical protein